MNRPHTEETKQKMREKALLRKHTKSTIEKMRLKKGYLSNTWKGGGRGYHRKIAKAVYYEHHTNVICDNCGTPDKICIHHRDENYKNNSLKNLQALCRGCHCRHHNPARNKNVRKK